MEKEAVKSMIELSKSFEEADTVIEEFTRYKNTELKLAFLYGMFDVAILGAHGADNDYESDYRSVVSTIINQKWR